MALLGGIKSYPFVTVNRCGSLHNSTTSVGFNPSIIPMLGENREEVIRFPSMLRMGLICGHGIGPPLHANIRST
jgi:hypothetical protein